MELSSAQAAAQQAAAQLAQQTEQAAQPDPQQAQRVERLERRLEESTEMATRNMLKVRMSGLCLCLCCLLRSVQSAVAGCLGQNKGRGSTWGQEAGGKKQEAEVKVACEDCKLMMVTQQPKPQFKYATNLSDPHTCPLASPSQVTELERALARVQQQRAEVQTEVGGNVVQTERQGAKMQT